LEVAKLWKLFVEAAEGLYAALALHFAYYNLCRVHGSSRVTSVMAAEIADMFGHWDNLLIPRLALLCVFVGSTLSADKPMQQGVYLSDTVTNPCHYDCPLPDHFWFCFATDDKVLIGETIAWRWQYDPKEMYKLRKQTVSLHYTTKNIWVIRTDGKELKLTRDDSYRDFTEGCQKIANDLKSSPR
jgi:hypothetical protein